MSGLTVDQLERSRQLARLAEHVADGRDVDWMAETSASGSVEEREVVRQLRDISTIRHMSSFGVMHGSPGRPASRPSSGEDTQPMPVDPSAGAPDPCPSSWGGLPILARLGEGSFGEVYHAKDELDREVALKVIRGAGDEGDRILDEARLLARVYHRNVVTVFGASRVGDDVGFWMELVRGRTLEAIRKWQGTFSAEEATLIGLSLCRALAEVHRVGLVHGDVKPQNVMRGASGRIVLMDFGAARLRRTRHGQQDRHVATPRYMAPELFRGGTPTVAGDLYSLGVLLYHLVSGSYPVSGTTPEAIRDAHLAGRRQWLRDARPDLPSSFVRAIDAAVAPRPGDRPASAGEMERLLERAADWDAWPKPAPVESSIAVLRFADASADRGLGYLCDGIADEVLNALARVPDLRVIGRGSSFRFGSADYDREDVASALRVETILEGRVRTAGDRLRVNAALVDAADGVCLWSETFDRQVGDVFAVQDDIARAVADALGARVVRARHVDAVGVDIAGTRDLEAYTRCLKGRMAWDQRHEAALLRAIGHFEAAIARDPEYAEAHAGLADACWTLGSYGGASPDVTMPRAQAAAHRAIALSARLPGPHATLGCIAAAWERRWHEADACFQRAIELAPSHPTVRQLEAITCLVPRRRFRDAIEALRRARDADPLSVPVHASMGVLHYFAHRFDDAERSLRETTHLDRGATTARLFLGLTLAEVGRAVEAQHELAVAQAMSPSPEMTAAIGYAAARAGDGKGARRAIASLEMLGGTRYVSPSLLAQVHAGLGDADTAIALLERAHAERAVDLLWLTVRPVFDGLHHDARVRALVNELGL
jgi:eukaryotic-like serine/threonine-protein kinase